MQAPKLNNLPKLFKIQKNKKKLKFTMSDTYITIKALFAK